MTSAPAASEAPALKWWQRVRWRPTSHEEAVHYERRLLDNYTRGSYVASDVKIGPGSEDFIHTVVGGQAGAPAFVAIPGYSTGSAFLFKLFDGLSAAFHLHAVDLLGTGLSGRPPFRARGTAQAEAFFVDSLEAWRREQGLDKMVLMGHSMGGYLSACYAMAHPDRVQHLIMMCPAGVGRKPDDWQVPAVLRSPWTWRGQLFRLATGLWDWGVTPGTIIRCWGPWGPNLTQKYCRSRFTRQQQLSEEEVVVFEQYHYHTLGRRGSGEFALRHILEPFAWPRAPLEERMQQLGVPVTWLYGEHDWMDAKAARRLAAAIAAHRQPAFKGDLQVLITPDAGHYPAIDQPGAVLRQLADACSYLPEAACAAMRAEAARLPRHGRVVSDSQAALAAEMEVNPVAAAAHEASEM